MLCPAKNLGAVFPSGSFHVECGGLIVLSGVEGPPLFAEESPFVRDLLSSAHLPLTHLRD